MPKDEQGEKDLMSAMAALSALHQLPSKHKTPAKRKRRKSIFKTKKNKGDTEVEPEGEEFEYSWPKCVCGLRHPPIPSFTPPDQKKCTYYWQIADLFPFLTLHRALTSEIQFIEADVDHSGVIEMEELEALLRKIFGPMYNGRSAEKTFKEIDTDESGSIDFVEVLTVVNQLVQRQQTRIPHQIKDQYSKVCSIQ